jgi:hypothetical protein
MPSPMALGMQALGGRLRVAGGGGEDGGNGGTPNSGGGGDSGVGVVEAAGDRPGMPLPGARGASEEIGTVVGAGVGTGLLEGG